jgi:hypothetical protein
VENRRFYKTPTFCIAKVIGYIPKFPSEICADFVGKARSEKICNFKPSFLRSPLQPVKGYGTAAHFYFFILAHVKSMHSVLGFTHQSFGAQVFCPADS